MTSKNNKCKNVKNKGSKPGSKHNKIAFDMKCLAAKWQSYDKEKRAWLLSDMLDRLRIERAGKKKITIPATSVDEKTKETVATRVEATDEGVIAYWLGLKEADVKHMIKEQASDIAYRDQERARLYSLALDPSLEAGDEPVPADAGAAAEEGLVDENEAKRGNKAVANKPEIVAFYNKEIVPLKNRQDDLKLPSKTKLKANGMWVGIMAALELGVLDADVKAKTKRYAAFIGAQQAKKKKGNKARKPRGAALSAKTEKALTKGERKKMINFKYNDIPVSVVGSRTITTITGRGLTNVDAKSIAEKTLGGSWEVIDYTRMETGEEQWRARKVGSAKRRESPAHDQPIDVPTNAAIMSRQPTVTMKQFNQIGDPFTFPNYSVARVNALNYQVMAIYPIDPTKTGTSDSYRINVYQVKGPPPRTAGEITDAIQRAGNMIETGTAPSLKKARYWLYHKDPDWKNLAMQPRYKMLVLEYVRKHGHKKAEYKFGVAAVRDATRGNGAEAAQPISKTVRAKIAKQIGERVMRRDFAYTIEHQGDEYITRFNWKEGAEINGVVAMATIYLRPAHNDVLVSGDIRPAVGRGPYLPTGFGKKGQDIFYSKVRPRFVGSGFKELPYADVDDRKVSFKGMYKLGNAKMVTVKDLEVINEFVHQSIGAWVGYGPKMNASAAGKSITLAEAAKLLKDADLAPGDTEIWYMTSDFFVSKGRLILYTDNDPIIEQDFPNTVAELKKTHRMVGKVTTTDPETIYGKMQGEYWGMRFRKQVGKDSRGFPIFDPIEPMSLPTGVGHTSMMVGDIIRLPSGKSYIVAPTKFWERMITGKAANKAKENWVTYKGHYLIPSGKGKTTDYFAVWRISPSEYVGRGDSVAEAKQVVDLLATTPNKKQGDVPAPAKRGISIRVRSPGKKAWLWFKRKEGKYVVTKVDAKGARQFSWLDVGDLKTPGLQGLAFLVGFPASKEKPVERGSKLNPKKFVVQKIWVEKAVLGLSADYTAKKLANTIKKMYGDDITKKLGISDFKIVPKGKDYQLEAIK